MAKKAAKKYTQHMRDHKKGRRADMRWQFEDEANATMKKGRSTSELARNKKPKIKPPTKPRVKKKATKKKRPMPTKDELTRIGVNKHGQSIHLKKKKKKTKATSKSKRYANQK